MITRLPDHAKGLLLAAFGGLVLTIDIPLLRLADGEPWSVMLMRSLLVMGAAGLLVVYLRIRDGKMPVVIPGKAGWYAAMLYGAGAVTFLVSVFNTTTANLVFILAFNPMFAAMLSWIFLKERPRTVTLIAMIIMAGGVLIIVHDGLGAGHFLGDMMALVTGLMIAAAITITRASGKDMGYTPLVGAFVPFVAAAAMTSSAGFSVAEPWWLILNGLVIIPVSFFCLAAAPKYISGAEVAMFYLLETVLTPVWTWIIFVEVPSSQTIIGGVILIVTLVFHSIWQLVAGRKRRAAQAVRHPA